MPDLVDMSADGEAEAGRFSAADRSIVTAQCLPLLAGYFADAPTWALRSQGQLDGTKDATGDLANFVRMRVAIASFTRLEPLLGAIVAQPSFFYALEHEESVGDLRGTLDMTRYLRTRLRPESPRRYPVRVINRRFTTPENIAAAYAALLMARDLADAPLHVLPPGAPEYRSVLAGMAQLHRWLAMPAFGQNRDEAIQVRRHRRVDEVIGRARRRIDGGRVAGHERYSRLLDWLETAERRTADTAAGQVDWSFYDERFDTKLFEIWGLGRLIQACEVVMGPPTQAAGSLLERARSPIRSWNFGAVKVRLYFQPGLSRLSGEPAVWKITEPVTSYLAGFPDLGVTITPVGQAPIVVLVDPKLRRRDSAPSDELYKLIGYFGNLPPQPVKGAILYYSPSGATTYRLDKAGGGDLLAIGIDLGDDAATTAQFARVAEMIRATAAVPKGLITKLAGVAGDRETAEEVMTSIRQQLAVQTMEAAAAVLAPASLAPVEKTTSASLAAFWDRLSPDLQRMIVTAEYFGATAPKDADHSGPLLGLAAACEGVLADMLFQALSIKRDDLFPNGATFGTMIHWLTDSGRRSPRDEQGRYLYGEMVRNPSINQKLVWHMTSDLRMLNVAYRIPAAHRELVSQTLWAEGRSLILDPSNGLLRRLVTAIAGP